MEGGYIMKSFNGGVEIRLTKEDLKEMLEFAINRRIFRDTMATHKVDELTVHPSNKYVTRITLSPVCDS